MTAMTESFVHAASAYRTDPERWETCSHEPRDVDELRVELVLTPGGLYRVEVAATLLVLGDAGSVAFAPLLLRNGRRQQAPWSEVARPAGMEWARHAFPGILGTGRPITIGLMIRATGESVRYSNGALTAIAIPEFPITARPGIGWTLRLA